MDPHDLRVALRGRAVLLVHENDFLRRYLADVLADNGATISAHASAGIAVTDAIRDATPPPVLVLSDSVGGAEAWVDEARARGIPVLLLQSSRLAVGRAAADRVMRPPFSGFQVAETVAALIHEAERRLAVGDEA
jgi:DNA-binding response OmpR family regulator